MVNACGIIRICGKAYILEVLQELHDTFISGYYGKARHLDI
jgi:hypothetical protein